jgi:hypothetical protein
MKNPFERRDNTVLVASVVVGSVAVGAATYFLLTEAGSKIRERFTNQFNSLRTRFAGGGDIEQHAHPEAAYIHKRKKSPKTDREALLKHEVINAPDNNEVAEE